MKTFKAFSTFILAGLAALASACWLSGCETESANRAQLAPVEFAINPSHKEIMAGETVTVTTRSANLVGRNARINWTTTGGELTTEQNGRVARVRFEQPGTYTVSARLDVDGDLVETDSVNVTVRPLNR